MLPVYSLRSLLVFSFLFKFAVSEPKCYGLDGSRLSDAYGACNATADHSGCCATRASAGSADLCLSNGLCMATSGKYMGTMWQSGCTDPTGMDPSCPKMCPDARDSFANGSAVPAWNVQTCNYGSYCCRAAGDQDSCCNNATAPQIKTNFIGAFQLESSSTGSSSTRSPSSTTLLLRSSATSSSSASPTEVDAAATSSANTLPTGPAQANLCAEEKRRTNVVGGTLAGFFCAAIVSLLAAIFFLFQKEKKQRKLKEHYEEQFASTNWRAYGSGMPSRSTFVEGDSTNAPVDKDLEVRYIGRQNT